MLLKQIEEQSVKIKEMENMIHILKNQYIIPIETPMWDHSWDIHRYPMLEYTDGTKFHFVPYISWYGFNIYIRWRNHTITQSHI